MRRRWIALGPDATLEDAYQLMRLARVRELPVVEGEILLGVLAYRDVTARRLRDRWHGAEGPAPPVRALLGPAPAVGSAETPLREAVARMARGRVGWIAVVEDTAAGPRLIGLATEADLLRAAYDARVAASES